MGEQRRSAEDLAADRVHRVLDLAHDLARRRFGPRVTPAVVLNVYDLVREEVARVQAAETMAGRGVAGPAVNRARRTA